MFYRERYPALDCPLTSEMQSAALLFFKVAHETNVKDTHVKKIYLLIISEEAIAILFQFRVKRRSRSLEK